MGSTEAAYRYIKENGITSGVNYPFKAREGVSCKYNETMKIATLSDFRRVPISNDDFLRVIFNCKLSLHATIYWLLGSAVVVWTVVGWSQRFTFLFSKL